MGFVTQCLQLLHCLFQLGQGTAGNHNDFILGQVQRHDCFVGFGTVHADMEGLTDEVERIDALLAKIAGLQDRRNVTDVDTEPTVTVEPKPEPTADEPDFIIVEE